MELENQNMKKLHNDENWVTILMKIIEETKKKSLKNENARTEQVTRA